jgi:hypothetical protein
VIYWNRYVNGATNIYKFHYNAVNNKERPNYLSRSKNFLGVLEEFSNQNLHAIEVILRCLGN